MLAFFNFCGMANLFMRPLLAEDRHPHLIYRGPLWAEAVWKPEKLAPTKNISHR
jgi:hypothetical protein